MEQNQKHSQSFWKNVRNKGKILVIFRMLGLEMIKFFSLTQAIYMSFIKEFKTLKNIDTYCKKAILSNQTDNFFSSETLLLHSLRLSCHGRDEFTSDKINFYKTIILKNIYEQFPHVFNGSLTYDGKYLPLKNFENILFIYRIMHQNIEGRPVLTKVLLKNAGIDDNHIKHMCTYIADMRRIDNSLKFDLEFPLNFFLTSKGVDNLRQCIENGGVSKLNLSMNSHISSKEWNDILRSMAMKEGINELVMDKVKLNLSNFSELCEILSKNENLYCISLSKVSFSEEGMKHLVKGLKSSIRFNSLTYLNLSWCSISTNGAHYIGEYLKACTSISELDMRGNILMTKGAKNLLLTLSKYNNSLRTLFLHSNGCENNELLHHTLKDVFEHNFSLSFLSIDDFSHNLYTNMNTNTLNIQVLICRKILFFPGQKILTFTCKESSMGYRYCLDHNENYNQGETIIFDKENFEM